MFRYSCFGVEVNYCAIHGLLQKGRPKDQPKSLKGIVRATFIERSLYLAITELRVTKTIKNHMFFVKNKG